MTRHKAANFAGCRTSWHTCSTRGGPAAGRRAIVTADECLDRGRERGREEHRLPGRRCGSEQLLDVLLEAHVEHPIRLVEDQHADGGQVERAAGEVVRQPARRADDDLAAPFQFGKLPFVGVASIERRHANSRLESTELAGLGADLHRQLPSRGEHQHLRRPIVRHDLLDRGNAEGRGLARARLRLADHVVPRHDRRDRRRLDRRRRREAELLDGLEQGRREAERRERGPVAGGRSGPGRRWMVLGHGRIARH